MSKPHYFREICSRILQTEIHRKFFEDFGNHTNSLAVWYDLRAYLELRPSYLRR
ncbi:hypothetical protein H6F42_07395 [Pseudanabaena sp. FACHB-1998]|nr:hypothetical protein [Pseudanabaena sp. FACHB-1998]